MRQLARFAPAICHIGKVRTVVRSGRITHPRGFFPIGSADIRQPRVALGPGVHLARECVENGWSRLQWAVLDWNAPSIAFYKSLGAIMLEDWTLCRVTGPALTRLAGSAT